MMLNTKGYIKIDSEIRKEKAQLIRRKRSLKRTKIRIQKNKDKKLKYQLSTVKKAFKVNRLDDLVSMASNLVNQNKQLKAQLAQSQQNQQQPQPQQSKQSSF